MDNSNFVVPANKSFDHVPKKHLPCPFTPSGMLLPSHQQPPPMYTVRGATIPPKHMSPYNKPRFANYNAGSRLQSHHQTNNSFHKKPNQFRNNNYANRNDANNFSRNQTSCKEFFCETCDRDFKSLDQLEGHKTLHQKCGIDGCNFEGVEQMVSKHRQAIHQSGLYEKIKNVSTEEDIAKWREERKKRYPTAKNVEMRQLIREEKHKRGERLEEPNKRFGNVKKNQHQQKDEASSSQTVKDKGNKQTENKRKRKRKNEARKTLAVKEVKNTVEEESDESEQINEIVKKFKGTGNMQDYRKQSVTKNALVGLLGMYDDDDDESEEEEDSPKTVDPIMNVIVAVSQNNVQKAEPVELEEYLPKNTKSENKKISEIFQCDLEDKIEHIEKQCTIRQPIEDSTSDNEAPQEETFVKIKEIIEQPPTKEKKQQQPHKKEIRKKPKTILDLTKQYRNQNTMLEKLLQKDIRHERNVLLQCVRFVVEKNFFRKK